MTVKFSFVTSKPARKPGDATPVKVKAASDTIYR